MRPPGKILRRSIHHQDVAQKIGDHHRVGHRAQRGPQQGLAFFQFPLHLVLIERDLDRRVQRCMRNRFHQVSEGACYFGPVQRLPVGMRRQEDYRQVILLPNARRRLHSVHRAVDADIHQYNVRSGRHRQRLLTVSTVPTTSCPSASRRVARIVCDQPFIFHHQHSAGIAVHCSPPGMRF